MNPLLASLREIGTNALMGMMTLLIWPLFAASFSGAMLAGVGVMRVVDGTGETWELATSGAMLLIAALLLWLALKLRSWLGRLRARAA